ncbi:sialin [Drosophila grimshawi]|uniref:GH13100 n=1 Tax=Drosophila grimshawi TaxID=7222 RepID=B4JQX7_DROGR|nr:sialin [Drosophila grimshawi]EDV99307.1 GH13100 [Drosophila grimshawi]
MLPVIQCILRDLFNHLQVTQRLVVCCFSLLAVINAYAIRLCLDFTLQRIVRDSNKLKVEGELELGSPSNPPTRQRGGGSPTNQPQHKNTLQIKLPQNLFITTSNSTDIWSKEVQALVSISFYAGYMITHIPGGRLAERYGGKWILGGSILLSAMLTLLTPTIVRNGGPNALIFLRLLIGVCEGPTFPAISVLLAQWVPEKERALLCSCVLSGGEIGTTFTHLVSGFGLNDQDWAVAFYVVGSGALLWFVGFVLVCYSSPDASPYIESGELDYIRDQVSATLVNEDAGASGNVPWSSMLMNAPIWALVVANMQHDWSQQKLAKELVQLLDELERNGKTIWMELESSLQLIAPHLCSWLASIISGSLSDYLIDKGILSRTQTRRLMSWLVFVSISMHLVHHQESFARSWIILAFGAYYAGIKLLPLDMSPNFAGTLMGISNGLGALPGLLMPLLQQLESEYAIVGTIRAALWLVCAGYISGDVQSYNEMPIRV